MFWPDICIPEFPANMGLLEVEISIMEGWLCPGVGGFWRMMGFCICMLEMLEEGKLCVDICILEVETWTCCNPAPANMGLLELEMLRIFCWLCPAT